MRSKVSKVSQVHFITHGTADQKVLRTHPDGTPVVDNHGDRIYDTVPGEIVTLGVHLKRSNSPADRERQGSDPKSAVYNGRVVLTTDTTDDQGNPVRTPLELLDNVTRYGLTLDGLSGQLLILPVPDSQHPKVRAKLGRTFVGQFTA